MSASDELKLLLRISDNLNSYEWVAKICTGKLMDEGARRISVATYCELFSIIIKKKKKKRQFRKRKSLVKMKR